MSKEFEGIIRAQQELHGRIAQGREGELDGRIGGGASAGPGSKLGKVRVFS